MRTMRAARAAGLLALCLFLFAGCAPEGDLMGLNALPTDPGSPTFLTVEDCPVAAACEESCQND